MRNGSRALASKELAEIVGDRMLAEVQAVIPEYTEKQMMADLKDLKTIFKTRRS